jgi:hypothetical protein
MLSVRTISFQKYSIGGEEIQHKRSAYIIKEEVTPNLNFKLTECYDTAVVGDTIYFLLPGQVVRYNIPYNIFEETVKLTESKKSFPKSFIDIQRLSVLDGNFFYWRQYARSDYHTPIGSYLYMDSIEPTEDADILALLRRRSLKLEMVTFNGLCAHLPDIKVDPLCEQISSFIDFNTISISPYLHKN